MALIVRHSCFLVISLLRVILIHCEMTFSHAQSQQCVSSKCIRVQEVHHNPRKYSPYPSLTNRHLSSTPKLLCPERLLLCYPFCCFSEPSSPHQPTELTQASFVAPRMARKETDNEHRYFKSSESNQNHRNNVNSGKSP